MSKTLVATKVKGKDVQPMDYKTMKHMMWQRWVDEGTVSQEYADKQIRVQDFLMDSDEEDLCSMIDSSRFNWIIHSFLVYAMNQANVDRHIKNDVLDQLRWAFDEHTVKDILALAI